MYLPYVRYLEDVRYPSARSLPYPGKRVEQEGHHEAGYGHHVYISTYVT
jgi:hypothetical protein